MFNTLSLWFNMTLRADMLKSNHLGYWIFEISSVHTLVVFSILFFNCLKIYLLEFDDSQKLWAFWVAWGLGTLRLSTVWIYIWVCKKLHLFMCVNILKNLMKKMTFPKSIQDQSGMVPGSPGHEKNINLNALEASGIIKNIKKVIKVINSKIDKENEEIGG